jgi:mono/diheme cytochrome c family protein
MGISLLVLAAGGGWLQPSGGSVQASSQGDKAAGAVLFHESGCEHCHGSDGQGTDKAPDLSTVGKRLSKEQIEHQIREGGKSMPAFGDALQPDQIQDLVAFLHEKKKARGTGH